MLKVEDGEGGGGGGDDDDDDDGGKAWQRHRSPIPHQSHLLLWLCG